MADSPTLTIIYSLAFTSFILGILGTISFALNYSGFNQYGFFVAAGMKNGTTARYIIGCTNETIAGISPINIDNQDILTIFHKCPTISSNLMCLASVCNGARQCVESLSPGAQCASNAQCTSLLGAGYECNLDTCQCEPSLSCHRDSHCPMISSRQCVEYGCASNGRCEEKLAVGASCSTDEECVNELGTGFRCNVDACQCVPAVVCTENGDCPLTLGDCNEFVCNGGFCEERLAGGAECSSTDMCQQTLTTGYRCDLGNCKCVPYVAPGVSMGCTIDRDCPAVTDRQCVETVCIDERCLERTVDGHQCSIDEECRTAVGPGSVCNTATCTCEERQICVSTADCPTTIQDCLHYSCNETTNRCVEEISGFGECYSSDFCKQKYGAYFQCSLETCGCVYAPPPFELTCSSDSHCPVLLSGCSRIACEEGRCVEVLRPNATCATSDACLETTGVGSYCDAGTCSCIHAPYGRWCRASSSAMMNLPVSIGNVVPVSTLQQGAGTNFCMLGANAVHLNLTRGASGSSTSPVRVHYSVFVGAQISTSNVHVHVHPQMDCGNGFVDIPTAGAFFLASSIGQTATISQTFVADLSATSTCKIRFALDITNSPGRYLTLVNVPTLSAYFEEIYKG